MTTERYDNNTTNATTPNPACGSFNNLIANSNEYSDLRAFQRAKRAQRHAIVRTTRFCPSEVGAVEGWVLGLIVAVA
ncbi:MAG: hypothetical protein QW429_05340, partial [Thermoprotei archaeon]